MSQVSDSVKALMVERLQSLKLAPSRVSKRHVQTPRATGGRKVSLRNTGRLKQFLDLPLDVIFTIASSFEPRDLLSLSRVTKEFRALLLSRSARLVWQAALEAVPDLPRCPPDLNEPQYASLLFEQYCFACDKVRGGQAYYTLRIRMCAPCSRTNISIGARIPAIMYNPSVCSLIPRSILGKGPVLVDLLNFAIVQKRNPAADTDSADSEENGGDKSSFAITSSTNLKWHRYLKSEAELVYSRCQAARHDPVTYKKLVTDYQTMATNLLQHGIAIIHWEQALNEQKELEEDLICRKRRRQIRKKMKEMGWDPNYYPSCDDDGKDLQKWYDFINQPKELTESTWSTMLPKLKAIYQRARTRRLQIEEAHTAPIIEFTMEEI